jgi:hypothetical protein
MMTGTPGGGAPETTKKDICKIRGLRGFCLRGDRSLLNMTIIKVYS